MDFSVARQNMVESQIRPNGITDEALISALGDVEREKFVPEANRSFAYVGESMPLENDRFMLDPMSFGKLAQLARITSEDLVLDIGPGSGYSTAVIAQLAESVVGVEADEALCDAAGQTLIDLGVTNAAIICGEHCKGLQSEAPFDVIIINGRLAEIPDELVAQLAEGGRLVAIVGEKYDSHAVLLVKSDGKISHRTGFDISAPLLCDFQSAAPPFSF
jgi:protein-L-isoaspartate(D-aspartate) O-methyltransferase